MSCEKDMHDHYAGQIAVLKAELAEAKALMADLRDQWFNNEHKTDRAWMRQVAISVDSFDKFLSGEPETGE